MKFTWLMAESIRSFDGDQEYIESIDVKIKNLKDNINRTKSELNEKFQDFILSVSKCKEDIVLKIDETLHLAITESTEHKMKIANLSGKKEISKQNEFQSEIQNEKLKAINIPEITLEWNIDVLKQQLEDVCKVVTTNHPYAYLNSSMKPVDCKVDLKSEPKSFEIDPINGDVYFLCNNDKDDNMDFKIFAINRFGEQKWDTKMLERTFCPVSLCIGDTCIFVSCSGSSHRSKVRSSGKILPDESIKESHDHMLMIEKESGKMNHAIISDQQEIGPIAFDPNSRKIFLLTKTKDSPHLSIFDSDGIRGEEDIVLKNNRRGFIFAAPKIRKIEITQDKIVLFWVDCIDFFNLEGNLLHTLPECTGLTTVDPWLNILKLDKESSEIIILTKEGKCMTKCVLRNKCTPVDLKYDISTGRILILSLPSLSRLCLVYLQVVIT